MIKLEYQCWQVDLIGMQKKCNIVLTPLFKKQVRSKIFLQFVIFRKGINIDITGRIADLIHAVCFFFVNRISPFLFTLDESILLRSKAASQAVPTQAPADCQQERKFEFRKFPVFEYFKNFKQNYFKRKDLCLENYVLSSLEEFDLTIYLVRLDF